MRRCRSRATSAAGRGRRVRKKRTGLAAGTDRASKEYRRPTVPNASYVGVEEDPTSLQQFSTTSLAHQLLIRFPTDDDRTSPATPRTDIQNAAQRRTGVLDVVRQASEGPTAACQLKRKEKA
jgi:hypothetical protein